MSSFVEGGEALERRGVIATDPRSGRGALGADGRAPYTFFGRDGSGTETEERTAVRVSGRTPQGWGLATPQSSMSLCNCWMVERP
jgi:hypothetical protein